MSAGCKEFERVTVSGMFRSGTTLLSRMLGASGESLVVSDPLVYFFKAYRNLHAGLLGVSGWHPDEPTCDAFRPRFPKVQAAIQSGDLSEIVPRATLAKFKQDLLRWKGSQHPRLCAELDQLREGSFADLYRQVTGLMVDLYARDETRLVGVKVSWCEEFLPAMARAFPGMRFVMVVRDLRSIVASQDSQSVVGVGKRPMLFYVRHWRKSVAYTRSFERELGGRVHVLRYEDLVRDPRSVLGGLCSFLGVSFREDMLDTACYRDLDENGEWVPNSAFEEGGEPKRGLFTDSIDRWKTVLSSEQVRTIESLAGPELVSMGYGLSSTPLDPLECMEFDCEPRPEELAPWIREFCCCDYLVEPGQREQEYRWESRRRALIEGAGILLPGEEDLVLDPRVLEDLRRAWGTVSRAA